MPRLDAQFYAQVAAQLSAVYVVNCLINQLRLIGDMPPGPSGCTVASSVVGVVVIVLTLTLTSDDLESHIVMNVSSTSNVVPSLINIG